MQTIANINAHQLMRRSMLGADARDPVIPYVPKARKRRLRPRGTS